MKYFVRMAAVLCVFAAILLGCNANVSTPIAVTGVTLNKSELTLKEGTSEQLTAKVLPAKATNKAVTWSSDKPAIASVDAKGTVTAHKAGEAVITVKTEDGAKTASCKVTVTLTEYAITYNLNGGSNHADNPAKYTVETETITLKDAAKANYTFAGWYDNAGCSGSPITQIAKGSTGNKEFWAKWQPSANTAYKVEHLQQNVEGNEYTTVDTEDKTGVTGAMTEAQAKTYTGFRSLGIVQKPIAADGLTVVQIKYDRNHITLTLDLKGGTITPPLPENKLKGRFGADVPAVANPTKEGYIFSVWNPELPKKFPAEDKTYTAQWANEGDYTITYHLDGDSYNSNPASYNVETATITLNPAIKMGYTFKGWYDNAACSGSPVTKIEKGSTGNKEFWPKWEARSYTITYHLNGGENGAGNPANYTIETETIILNPAVKTGYDFAGWYDNAACIGSSVMHIAKGNKENKEFWAKWEAHSYTITYHLNNGSNHADNPENYTIETETITLQDASKASYTFAGWYDNASCSGSPVTHIGKGSTGNKTFWAKWEVITYSIAYNLNGGNHSGNPVSYTVETETITLQDASKANYTFAGWYDNAGFTGEKVTQIAKGNSGNKAFWAKWEARSYTITYNLNGGYHSGNPVSYTVETETVTLKDAKRTGYDFKGWYNNEACSGSPITQIAQGSTGNKAFWAKWEVITYSIAYNLNGGSHSGNPVSYTVETTTITLNPAIKIGYTFKGWYDNASCSGSPKTYIYGSTENKEFWAKWEVVTYTITYNLNDGSNHADNPAKYTVETETITLKGAERTGYAFVGWYDNAACSGSPVTHIGKGSTENKAFWAKWRINEYTVTFGVEGEHGTLTAEAEGIAATADSPITVEHGKKVTFTATPTSSGYVIGTWEVTPKKALIRNEPVGDNAVTVKITAETAVKVRFVPGKTYTVEGVSFTMKDIAAVTDGTVGHSAESDNKPHTISLTAYRIGETEVTQELWEKVMGVNPSYFKDNPASGEVQGKRPVERINWYHAIAFCNKLSLKLGLEPFYRVTVSGSPIDFETLAFSEIPTSFNLAWTNPVFDMSKNGFRLPTEAEWEWAAKGGKDYRWAGTDTEGELKDYAWYIADMPWQTHEVKKKEPNGYGLYDMSGNVEEWCWDRKSKLPDPLPADYLGADGGYRRVLRGGYYTAHSSTVSRASRFNSDAPEAESDNRGFRLACRP